MLEHTRRIVPAQWETADYIGIYFCYCVVCDFTIINSLTSINVAWNNHRRVQWE